MTREVFITEIASFLPNAPVSNEDMEKILGMAGNRPSRSRRLVLKNNGIKTRHYAIDPSTGKYTHNNTEMTAEAVKRLLAMSGFPPQDIECLCCGTSSPDQLKPAHGPMVQGALGLPPIEVVTTAGVCTSGMTGMKYGYMSVASGLTSNAICTGSEFASSFMRGANFEPELESSVEGLKKHPSVAFEKDFLRWMLSDGAGAVMISERPNNDRLSLRIDWIDIVSFAGDMDVCMYSGAIKRKDGSLKGWREAESSDDILKEGYFTVKQDIRLLDENIIRISVEDALLPITKKHNLKPDDVTWFLPHYSSEYFRPRLYDSMAANGFPIPYDRWFTNLTSKGNIGSAAIYLILEEMMYSGRLRKADRLLCYIPESGRFSICYMHLTVV